jgi:hypothetical protein
MTANQKQLEAFRRSNVAAAEIILADVAKYGGKEALLVQWARLILQREPEPSASRRAGKTQPNILRGTDGQ